MRKKIITILMIAIMAVFGVAWFAACDSEDEPASNNPPGDEVVM